MQEQRCADGGDDDARLPDGGHRGRLGARERCEDEAVGDPHPDAREEGRRAQLGAKRCASLEPGDPERVADRGDDQHELEVGDRVRVADALVVHERVRSDRARDGDPEEDARGAGRAAEAAYKQNAQADQADAERLHRGRLGVERHDADDQDEHRGDPPRQRVDDRDLRALVGGAEKGEVDELEQ